MHPPKIPRKSLVGPVRAGLMSASSADWGGASIVVPRLQKTAQTASSSTQQGRKQKGRKGKALFSSASDGSGRPGHRHGGAGKKSS